MLRLRHLLSLCLTILALLVPFASAHADTYSIVTLFSDEGNFFAGISDSGLVVLDQPADSACGGATCYFSFLNGVGTGPASAAAPVFTADNGSACTPSVPTGFIFRSGVCNNGSFAFTGYSSSSVSHPSLYDDLPTPDLLGDGSGSFLFMNGVGDIVWNDPVRENWVEAIDTTVATTPEPSSLLLLATGVLPFGAFAFSRRRTQLAINSLSS